MFTGIIEEIGIIKSISHLGGGIRFSVQAKSILEDLKIDDSVSLNGVCQTVIARTDSTFDFIAVEETLRKTTLNKFRTGQKLNLERALKVSARLGGHIVQGHVDCVGNVIALNQESTGKLIRIHFQSNFSKYIVPVGSIAIDGVSLTVAGKERDNFYVAVIPHSIEMTTLKELRVGSEVNLEFDILGKYIESMIAEGKSYNNQTNKSILEQYINQPEI